MVSDDYTDYFPWRDNGNWLGLTWSPRGVAVKAIDKLYFWFVLIGPLGWWYWKGWRLLFVMRARFYFEFRHELEHPDAYGRETLDYAFFNLPKEVK